MAVIAHIEWTAVPGSLGYFIEYKEQSSSVWLTPGPPTNPANPTLNLYYDLEIEEGTYYDGRISSQCSGGTVKYRYFQLYENSEPIWIEDTYTCEQDDPFSIGDTYSGFSSPIFLHWDETQQRFYIVDWDDASGNLYWINPSTFTGFGDQTYISGSIAPGTHNLIQSADSSPSLRKIFMGGPDTSGVMVYDISANTITTINDGTTNGPFARLFTRIINGTLYVGNQLAGTITLINPATDSVIGSPILTSSIPGNTGNKYFNNSYYIHPVNGELWVCAAYARATSGNIARYNSDFSSFLGEIVIPGAATATGGTWNNRYWQGHFYDSAKNRFYLADAGSFTNTVIDTTTNTVIEQVPVSNMEGKNYPIINWSLNGLTGQLYANKQSQDTPEGTGGVINKFYVQNRDNYEYESMYLNQLTNGLTLRPGSNEFWAVTPGVTWNAAGWDTDGIIFKYTV